MTVIDELHRCSFKGVPCLCIRSTRTGGRNIIVHEFPNSDRRETQDLGLTQPTFQMTLRITGTGIDYIEKRDALITALNSKDRGLLVHHFYGDQMVFATQHSIAENISTIGIADFTVTFVKADLQLFPTESSDNLPKINQGRENVLAAISNNIASEWIDPNRKAQNFEDAQRKLLDVANTFVRSVESIQTGGIQGLVSGVAGLTSLPGISDLARITSFDVLVNQVGGIEVLNQLSETSDFQSVTKSFIEAINPNILNAVNLGEDFVGLFPSASKTANSPEAGLNLYKPMFTFGDDDSVIQPTTQARTERIKNRQVLNRNMQIGALAESYQISTGITYKNDVQLQGVRDDLENQYQKVIDDPDQIVTRVLIELSDLRDEMRKFFEQEAVTTPTVTPIETPQIPITVLVHQFYGNLDQLEAINDLNDFDNPTFVEGTVDILTNISSEV